MEIGSSPALLPSPTVTGRVTSLLAQLPPGQILLAEVETRLSESSYRLRLTESGQTLRAQSSLNLAPGTLLKLEVTQPGNPPQLRLLPSTDTEDAATRATQHALRNYLPHQLNLDEVTRTLRHALQALTGSVTEPSLPRSVRLALDALLDAVPTQAELATPAGLKKAFENSGLFLEARLATALRDGKPLPSGSDFKSRLLNLLTQLTSVTKSQTPSFDTPTPAPGDARIWPDAKAAPTPSLPGTQASSLTGTTPETADEVPGILLGANRSLAAHDRTANTPPSACQTPSPRTDPGHPGPAAEVIPLPTLSAPNRSGQDTTLLVDEIEGRQPKLVMDKPSTTTPDAPCDDEDAFASPTSELKPMLHKTEGALARVVLDQLASQPQPDGKQTAWQVEIPFTAGNHTDSARLKIVRERKTESGPEGTFWSVTLELNPPGLGRVHSRITLASGHVDSYFWSDQPATTDLIHANLNMLAARLQQAGLDIGRLDTVPVAPAEPVPDTVLARAGLVSERV